MAFPMLVVGLSLLLSAAQATDTNGVNSTCFLLKDHFSGTNQYLFTYKQPSKPFPSLTQCYKNNQGACCVSAHDAYIESMYHEILSQTCLRQFTYLEQYYCLGCNPDQGKWVVGNNYTYDSTDADGLPQWNFDLRICTSFMNYLYTPEDDLYNYDKCGLLDNGVGYLPTSRYTNASQFINDIKPPYFEHVNWVEINDVTKPNGDAWDENTECVVPDVGQELSVDELACCFSSALTPQTPRLLLVATVLLALWHLKARC